MRLLEDRNLMKNHINPLLVDVIYAFFYEEDLTFHVFLAPLKTEEKGKKYFSRRLEVFKQSRRS